MKLYKKQHLTIVQKRKEGYIVTRCEYVGLNFDKATATFDSITDTAHFFGHKVKTKNVDKLFKAVKAHYAKRYALWAQLFLKLESTSI